MLLKIDLQDGFSNDIVAIRINDTEVFSKKSVTTKVVIGLADSIELDVADNPVKVEVAIPSKNLSETIPLDMSLPVYLGISVTGSQIFYMISEKPFAYF